MTFSKSSGDSEAFEGIWLIGLIVGFVSTGIFIAYAATVIIIDEVDRHNRFKKDIEEAKKDLRDERKFGVTQDQLNQMLAEFDRREKNRGKGEDAEKARQELAEIN